MNLSHLSRPPLSLTPAVPQVETKDTTAHLSSQLPHALFKEKISVREGLHERMIALDTCRLVEESAEQGAHVRAWQRPGVALLSIEGQEYLLPLSFLCSSHLICR